jgi:hypothetical protein
LGKRPPLRSEMICMVHPSSATTCSLVRVVTVRRRSHDRELTVWVGPGVHGDVTPVAYCSLHSSGAKMSADVTTGAYLDRMLPPIMKCVALLEMLLVSRNV